MNLEDVCALVTGAASGLGRATAVHLCERGGRVALLDLPGKEVEMVAKGLGSNAIGIEGDVTKPDEIQNALERVTDAFGSVNGVVNCAGVAMAQRTVGRNGPHDLESFAYCLNVNAVGSFNVIRLAAAQMADNSPLDTGERGVIVNTASVAAYDGQIGQAAYAASKGAIVGMTLPIARDLSRMGIRVMTIAPGIFNTPMMNMLPQEAKDQLCANIPFPSRLGEPSEYADLVSTIFTNSMLNGEVIRLDGAIRMPPR